MHMVNLCYVIKNSISRRIWSNRHEVKCSPPLTDPEIYSLYDLPSSKLQWKWNYKNLITGHLNINYIRKKYERLGEIIKDFDIFLISESKLDFTFPNEQFKISDFKIFRYDQNRFGGGLLLCLNDKIPSKFFNKHPTLLFYPNHLIALEFHQNIPKWLCLYVYNLQTSKTSKPPRSLWKQSVQLLTNTQPNKTRSYFWWF